MSFITIEVEDEEFQAWLIRTKRGVRSMIETMKDVAKVVRENTIPLTPIETTRLGKSFKWSVLENNSNFQIVQLRMSALNPKTGYDYAMTQHRGYHIDKNGHRVYYHYDGEPDIDYDSSSKVYHTHGYFLVDTRMWDAPSTGVGPKYLERGIINTQEDAFEMIEQDYLSLFTRGHIY